MKDVYVYDKDLRLTAIIDAYKSLIWSNRYRELGDCELYVPASTELLNVLRMGYYLQKEENDMICQIVKIELDTSAEEGNYIVATGHDVNRFLDQRIIWETMNADGNAELFIRKMVSDALGNTAIDIRQMKNESGDPIFFLGDVAGFTEALTEQTSYQNIGEKVRDYCIQYGWGYRTKMHDGKFYFELYKGTDRSASVVFAPDFENLSTTVYTEDKTNLGNVALIAGEGEGSERVRNVSGSAESTDRFEVYVDARDLSKTITWEELTRLYPTQSSGGQGYISGDASSGYVYMMTRLDIQIIDDEQLAKLRSDYPAGTIVTIGGIRYYRITNVAIADLGSSAPNSDDSVTLRDVVYTVYLITRGYEKLAEFGEVKTFEGTIEPNTTFVLNQDYFLGDIVRIRNEFGINLKARIVEIVEVDDDNGHSVEPKFEYMEGVQNDG